MTTNKGERVTPNDGSTLAQVEDALDDVLFYNDAENIKRAGLVYRLLGKLATETAPAEARARQAEQEADELRHRVDQGEHAMRVVQRDHDAARQAGYEECATKVREAMEPYRRGTATPFSALDRIREAVGPAPTPKGPEPAAKRKCDDCDGLGHVVVRDDPAGLYTDTCDRCGGSGNVHEPPAAPLEPEHVPSTGAPKAEAYDRNRRSRDLWAAPAPAAAAPQGAGPEEPAPAFVFTDEYGDTLTVRRFVDCWSFCADSEDDGEPVVVKVPNANAAALTRALAAPSAPQGGPDDAELAAVWAGLTTEERDAVLVLPAWCAGPPRVRAALAAKGLHTDASLDAQHAPLGQRLVAWVVRQPTDPQAWERLVEHGTPAASPSHGEPEQAHRTDRGPGTYHHGYVAGMWAALDAGPEEARAFVERRKAQGWTREEPGGGVRPPHGERPEPARGIGSGLAAVMLADEGSPIKRAAKPAYVPKVGDIPGLTYNGGPVHRDAIPGLERLQSTKAGLPCPLLCDGKPAVIVRKADGYAIVTASEVRPTSDEPGPGGAA